MEKPSLADHNIFPEPFIFIHKFINIQVILPRKKETFEVGGVLKGCTEERVADLQHIFTKVKVRSSLIKRFLTEIL